MARPRTVTRNKGVVYIANQSFVANIKDGRVMTDGSGIDKAFHEGRTRVNEGDHVLEWFPDAFDLLEDHTNDWS